MARAFPFHQVHWRRPGGGGKKRLAPKQRLALWTVVLLNGTCLALLGWSAYGQRVKAGENAGNVLQTALPSPKLNETSAKPVSLETPAAMITQEPVERTSEAPPTLSAPQDPLFAEPPRLGQLDSVPLAGDEEPILVFSSNHAHHQGDSPMLRTWKSLELAAILAAAFTAQPVLFAGEGGKKDDIKEILKRLDGIDSYLTKDLAKIFEKVASDHNSLKGDFLKARVDLDAVTLRMDMLEKAVDKLTKRLSGELSPIDKASLDEIKSKLGQIEQTLAKMQGPNRTAFSPPNTGRIMLVNLYPEELLFVVNGKNYRVPPNRTMPLDGQPAGVLTYEVIADRFGMIVRKTSTLDPNETFTITAR